MEAFDVEDIQLIEFQSDQGGIRPGDPKWFVNKVTIISSSQDRVYSFPCFRWIIQDLTLFPGQGKIRLEIQCI
jgi:hypothetical protein